MERFLLRIIRNVLYKNNNNNSLANTSGEFELLGILIVFFVILVVMFPITFPIIFIFFIAFVVINNKPENRRKNALAQARLYLSPYTNIWNNLKLTNKYCSVELTKRKEIIIKNLLFNSFNNYPTYKIKRINKDSDWDTLCFDFNYYTTFDEVMEFFINLNYKIETIENEQSIITNNVEQNISNNSIYNEPTMPVLKISDELEDKNTNKTDINNASEVEITALPGISIVLSKKLIQKREEIGGFKTIEEVFDFLKLKPHFESQLRKMICVNKMQGTIRIKKYKERRIDL